MMRVSFLACLIMALCWPVIPVADDLPEMSLDKTSVVFGLPVTITLRVKNQDEKLPDVDFTKLKTDFIVRNVETSRYSTMVAGHRVTTHEARFRLYARHPGTFRLPSIQWGTQRTQAATITVLPQDVAGPKIMLSASTDNANPRVRQPINIEIRLVSDRNLSAEPEVLHSPDFFIRTLPTQRQREERDAEFHYVTRFTWSIMPLKPGLQELKLPLLALGGRRLLPSGVISLNVTPLANFIPTYVPVGAVSLETETLVTAGWLKEPLTWQIRVYGEGVSGEAIARLMSDALRHTESIRFYPAEYVIKENSSGVTLPRSLLVSVPFVPLQTGELRLPELNIPYVDPNTGRLNQASIPSTAIKIRSPLHVGLLIGGIVLVALLLLLWVTRQARIYLQLRRQLRTTLKAVEAADTPDALARGLLNWTGTVWQQKYQTLTRWLNVFEKESRRPEIDCLVEKLERWRWQQPGSKQEFEDLKQQFSRVLK